MLQDPSAGGSVDFTGPAMLRRLQPHFERLRVSTLPKDTFMLSSLPFQAITCGSHGYDSTWVPKVFRPISSQLRHVPMDLLALALLLALAWWWTQRRRRRRP